MINHASHLNSQFDLKIQMDEPTSRDKAIVLEFLDRDQSERVFRKLADLEIRAGQIRFLTQEKQKLHELRRQKY